MTPNKPFYWEDFTTLEFNELAARGAIAILPIAATEQHGPHLSVATDTVIGRGMLEVLRQRIPNDLPACVLPIQAVAKSNEHLFAPGTLTIPADVLTMAWTSIGEGVHRAGFRKLLIVNSHGGNNPVMDIVARELRVRLTMLVVGTQWNRFGFPEGITDNKERRYGVHAGKVETSLMMRFRPDLVRKEKLQDFPSATAEFEKTFKHLRATGQHNMGWMIHDLNPDGAVGNALAGTAEIGAAIAEHQVAGAIELLKDMRAFDLARLATSLPESSQAGASHGTSKVA